ncbi:hypothetical protein D9M68_849960 [compost metagenome]
MHRHGGTAEAAHDGVGGYRGQLCQHASGAQGAVLADCGTSASSADQGAQLGKLDAQRSSGAKAEVRRGAGSDGGQQNGVGGAGDAKGDAD